MDLMLAAEATTAYVDVTSSPRQFWPDLQACEVWWKTHGISIA
jgi:hypothetical protein